MLEKLYASKTENELKSAFKLYSALLILSFVMPIIFSIVSYFLNGKISFTYNVPFIIVMIWSLMNVTYLKNRFLKK